MKRLTADDMVREYLKRVRAALESLSGSRREEIVLELEQHIRDARQGLNPDDEAGIVGILDRLGSPGEIAQASGVIPSSGKFDIWVPWALLLGGLVFFVGWLVGVGLLWSSQTWCLRDKVLGTVIWPGGLFLPLSVLLGVGGATSCTVSSSGASQCHSSGFVMPWPLGIIILIVVVAAPVTVAVHLDRVRRHRLAA